jgi:hypothetical protein
MLRLAPTTLVLDAVGHAPALEPLAIGFARIAFVGQHRLHTRRELLDDLGQPVDTGFIGRVHLHMLDVTISAIDGGAPTVAGRPACLY